MMIKRIWDITVTVTDIRKATDFYENVLGLQKKYEFKDYAGFDCGGIEIGLKTWGDLEKPRQGEPCINFLVDNIDTSYQALTEKGVTFSEKPSDTQWGSRIAVFNDPDGNSLQISEVDWPKYLSVSAPK
jgi:catechol 2,3-dioxygenase-like lactoylglutathione lyase family enzyme